MVIFSTESCFKLHHTWNSLPLHGKLFIMFLVIFLGEVNYYILLLKVIHLFSGYLSMLSCADSCQYSFFGVIFLVDNEGMLLPKKLGWSLEL